MWMISQKHLKRAESQIRSVWCPESRRGPELCLPSPSLGYTLQARASGYHLWAVCVVRAWKTLVAVVGRDSGQWCCTYRALASWPDPQKGPPCCSSWTSCSSRWTVCLGLEGPWLEGGSICLERGRSRCSCTVYGSAWWSMGVSSGGCMVEPSQGCMFLVQVSGSAALITDRSSTINNRCPDCLPPNRSDFQLEQLTLRPFRSSIRHRCSEQRISVSEGWIGTYSLI